MEEKEYVSLLEKAYEDLPQVLFKKARFEIPEVKGRLVKTRTMITNAREIAKHFSRDENHFFKFMLKEVGVRGELNQRGDITLFSRFQPAALNKAVKSYYNQYIECKHCNSPDTVFQNDGTVLKCNACGHQEKISKL